MGKYLVKRILLAIPTFIGCTLLVFVLANMAPGSPLDVMAAQSGGLSPEQYEALEKSLGLDKPVLVRYGIWLIDLIQGEMGTSTRVYKPVGDLIRECIGPTLLMTVSALLLCLIVAIPLGVLSAVKPGGICDGVSTVIAFLGTSVPGFFLCLLMIFVFSVKLQWLPAYGMYTSSAEREFMDVLRHMIMPSFVLGFGLMGDFIKQTRSSMLEVLNEEYVKTARSKGLKENKVVIRHILRNALIPIVTCISMAVPLLIGGSVVIEMIFGWPGIGTLMMNSVTARDYETITSVTAVISLAVLVCNCVLDIVYAWLDPRIAKDTGGGH